MENDLRDLIRRLDDHVGHLSNDVDHLSAQVEELRESVRHVAVVADVDPAMALTAARKVLDRILHRVWEHHIPQEPIGTRPLEEILQRLSKGGFMPRKQVAFATTVKELGNFGTHVHDEKTEKSDVAQALGPLILIMEWFVEQNWVSPPERSRPPEDARGPNASEHAPAPSTAPRPRTMASPIRPTRPSRRFWRVALAASAVLALGVATLIEAYGLRKGTESATSGQETAKEQSSSPENGEAKHAVSDQTPALPYSVQVPAVDLTTRGNVPIPALGSGPDEGSRAGEERDDNGLKMNFCWCPPGSFRMGSPASEPERGEEEGPVNVTLSRGFWMGKYEVTQEQWRQVMGGSVRDQAAKGPHETSLAGQGPDYPIYDVSYTEAEEFCRQLTESERRVGRLLVGWSYRLPTEAQWEYACRAGTTTATAFGDQLSSQDANFNGNYPYNDAPKGPYLESTTAVGKYRPNAWGLHDMHGNVFEWCLDGFAESLAGGIDPVGPSTALYRMFRGGGWFRNGSICRSATRGWDVREYRGNSMGFRVARVPSGP
jgi:formylglycine-generating enzyme